MGRQPDPSTNTPLRRQIVRGQTVARDLEKSLRTIHRWEAAGEFPRRVKLGPNSVGYFSDEVEAWKAARERRGGDRPPSGDVAPAPRVGARDDGVA